MIDLDLSPDSLDIEDPGDLADLGWDAAAIQAEFDAVAARIDASGTPQERRMLAHARKLHAESRRIRKSIGFKD